MCIAIYNSPKQILFDKTLRDSWKNNPDGAGLMYAHNGKIEVFKELTDMDKFIAKYFEVKKKYPSKNIVLHFRVKTHGEKDLNNCHPFVVNDTLAFVHNGVIKEEKPEFNSKVSDTYLFNENVLKKLGDDPSVIQNKAVQNLLKEYIGNSKLIFLDNTGTVTIINPKKGEWISECWFSNDSWYKKRAPKIPQYNSPYMQNLYGDSYISRFDTQNTKHHEGYCKECRRKLYTDAEKLNEQCAFCPNNNSKEAIKKANPHGEFCGKCNGLLYTQHEKLNSQCFTCLNNGSKCTECKAPLYYLQDKDRGTCITCDKALRRKNGLCSVCKLPNLLSEDSVKTGKCYPCRCEIETLVN